MKQSTNNEPFIPSEKTLEKLRCALRGDYDNPENTTTAINTPSENQIKERNNQS